MTTPQALAKSPKTFRERDDWMRAILASDLPDAAARVAMTLALHLHVDTGRCDPPYSILASKSHVSERSAYRLVALLEHTGWIAIQRVSGCLNHYTLLTTAKPMAGVTTAKPMAGVRAATTAKSDTEPLPKSGGTTANKVADNKRRQAKKEQAGRESISPAVAARDENKGTPDESDLFGKTESKPQAPRKNRGGRRSADDGEAFDRFWKAYPKRVAKEAARKAYDKALERGATDAALLAGAQRYAAERNGQDAKFTKHPATWLNGGCWEDELPGAPVIDQDGNVVAVEQSQHQENEEEPLHIRVVREMREAGVSW
jgi:hypothetical protein